MRPWRRLITAIARRGWVAFVLMGVFFFLFAVTSLNLIGLFKANIGLIIDHGLVALADGALVQLVELLVYGYLSGAFFVLFKVCEKLVVDRVAEHD